MYSQPYRTPLILLFVGGVLITIAVTIPLVFPILFERNMIEKLVIKPNSEIVEKFSEAPLPIFFQVWFFNITNTYEVYKGAKPRLQQLGPYTYKQTFKRIGLVWNHTRGTVKFRVQKHFYFDPEKSIGSEDDLVTTVNPVFITMASKVSSEDVSQTIKALAQLWFIRFGFKPFMTHKVGELLFRGYNEPLLGTLYQLTNDPLLANGKAGFFYPKNGTIEEETEVFTGELGMENYQTIFTWNHTSKLDYWKDKYCDMINGTEGSQYPRPVSKLQPIRLYNADLCRSIYAVFEKEVTHGALTLNRYVVPRDMMADTPENQCFCTNNFTCRTSMLDVTPCRNAPIVISTPHFYMGEDEDIKSVLGLHPTKDEHQSYIDVEPNIGVAMRVARRIQINMPLRRYANFPAVKNVPELIMPILWLNESAQAPIEITEMLHRVLTVPLQVVIYGSWAMLVIGFLLTFISSFFFLVTMGRKNIDLPTGKQLISDILLDPSCEKPLVTITRCFS